jgi:hypothetical protein
MDEASLTQIFRDYKSGKLLQICRNGEAGSLAAFATMPSAAADGTIFNPARNP